MSRLIEVRICNTDEVRFWPRLITQRNAVMTFVYNPTAFSARLALLLFYFRIFSSHGATRVVVYAGILVGLLYLTSSEIAILVFRVPRHGVQWLSAQYVAQCMPSEKTNYSQGIFGVVSDLYVFIVSLPILWTLQMPLRKKLGITATFLTGLM